jgi:oxygen-independent coproporphyrinogen-3 oxidase
VHGHTLTNTEKIAKQMILQLMCDDTTTFEPYSLPYTNMIEKELDEFAHDGLITKQKNKITLTSLGKAFLRNIAMIFDFHLRESKKQHFSQTV